MRLEDVAEQLDTIEGKLDEVVERSIQNEQDVLWLKWGVRGVGMAALSALVTGLVNLLGG